MSRRLWQVYVTQKSPPRGVHVLCCARRQPRTERKHARAMEHLREQRQAVRHDKAIAFLKEETAKEGAWLSRWKTSKANMCADDTDATSARLMATMWGSSPWLSHPPASALDHASAKQDEEATLRECHEVLSWLSVNGPNDAYAAHCVQCRRRHPDLEMHGQACADADLGGPTHRCMGCFNAAKGKPVGLQQRYSQGNSSLILRGYWSSRALLRTPRPSSRDRPSTRTR